MPYKGWVSTDINYVGDVRYFAWALIRGIPQLLGNLGSRTEAERFLAGIG